MIAFSPILPAPTSAALRDLFSPASPVSPIATRPQNVVIIYDDRAAGDRAMRTMAHVRTQSGPAVQFSPVPWSFHFLAELSWRSRAIRDVDTADLIILALSEPDEIPAAINHWINTCLHRERTAFIPVLLQFDDDDVWTIEPQKVDHALARETKPAIQTSIPGTQRKEKCPPFPFTRLSTRAVALRS